VTQRTEALVGWRAPGVLAAGGLACIAGFSQYAVTAVLADVAEAFGEEPPADGVAAEVGMAVTTLGIGLAVVRLASLASMPVAGLADRFGRRRVVLVCLAAGLVLSATASLAPGFWVFILFVALARPLLTGTNAVAAVIAAEETDSGGRAAAIAVVGGAYALGSGLVSVVRGVTTEVIGFRGVLLLALVPLALLPLFRRVLRETPRYSAAQPRSRRRLGVVPRPFAGRLVILCVVTASVGLVFGPVFTYLFVFGEGVLGLRPGTMALLVLAAGPAGLGGLLLGRLAADRLGRRLTAGVAMVVLAIGGLLAYRSGFGLLAVGYLTVIAAGAAYTPSGGALDTELFPTSIRATAAGWLSASGVLGGVVGLAVFGILADVFGTFAEAALVVSLPALLLPILYRLLPETRGMELEESAPEPGA
jgi:MFS family permease